MSHSNYKPLPDEFYEESFNIDRKTFDSMKEKFGSLPEIPVGEDDYVHQLASFYLHEDYYGTKECKAKFHKKVYSEFNPMERWSGDEEGEYPRSELVWVKYI